jgi:superfamily II DNA/RNA helicase
MGLATATYFEQHPDHILGQLITHNPNTDRLLTDAYGKPRPEVRGTLQDALSRIDAPMVQRYVHFVENSTTDNINANKRVSAVIALTRQEHSDKPSTDYVCGEDIVCLSDSIATYNKGVEYRRPDGTMGQYDISEEEITAFVTYQVSKGIWNVAVIGQNAWGKYINNSLPLREYFDRDILAFDGTQWIPSSLFYAGNIYDKIQSIQQNRSAIVEQVGENGFDKILKGLSDVRPKPLRFSTDPREALIVSPFDRLWDEVSFTEDSDGQPYENPVLVNHAFKQWVNQVPGNQFTADGGKITSNELDVKQLWLDARSFPRNSTLTDEQKATKKRNATIVGQILFERFCIEGISRDMQVKIEYLFNSTRNHHAPVQYHRIPVGFEASKKFKGGELKIRAAQREGVAFLSYRGTGIVAYDVGVGKTATAILSIEDGFSKGFWKRPLIVTPNGVYWKWVGEINGIKAEKDIIREGKKVAKKGDLIAEGILPHRKVNALFNLGAGVSVLTVSKGKAKMVEEGSITMLTYEGLEKIGFDENSERSLVEKVLSALSQGESGRGAALKEKAAEGWLDKALSGTEYSIEDFGFDAIIVDECHNFRVLFTEVKGDIDGDGEREVKRFQSGGSGQPSTRSVKLFLLNLYVQSKHSGRNTIGLSATPFTNRATEIYSMMAHFDYDGLAEFGVHNLAQFCKVFIDETSETVWTASGKFDIRYVIRGYNNVPVLQTILFRSINYKTGEEANIQRPQKIILPLFNDDKGLPLPAEYVISTRLPENKEQSRWLKDAYLFASPNFKDSAIYQTGLYPPNDKTKKPDGQVLVALNVARIATISPLAITLRGKAQYEPSKISFRQVIESSPKLDYTMKCIESVRNWHLQHNTPVSGQIIYCNAATGFFQFLKEYLVKEVGFADNEVELLTGETAQAKREKIKEGFQDNSIKIIIGSSAIREGMDLQNHCSVIYDLYLDWNPTDLHQLFGRGWRFGNKFSHVRIVAPLVENSADIFTWQKLSEKMSRLNSIWSRAGVTKMFEEGELNAEELKKGLITDPRELAKFEIGEERTIAESQKVVLEAEDIEVSEAIRFRDRLQQIEETLLETLREIDAKAYPDWWDNQYADRVKKFKEIMAMQATASDMPSVYRKIRAFSRFVSATSSAYILGWVDTRPIDEHLKAKKTLKRVEETILSAYKLPISQLGEAKTKIAERLEEIEATIERINSAEYFEQVLAIATAQKAEEAANRRSVDDRVKEFARLNYLLDCKFQVDMCDIYGRHGATKVQEPTPAPVQKPTSPLQDAIEALQTALEFSDHQPPLREAIEALEVALEFA